MISKPKLLALSALTAVGLLVGVVAGWSFGVRSARSIIADLATRGELVSGTGLVFFPFGFAILGMIVGAAPGIVGLVVTFRKESKGKNAWSAYYGR